MPLPGPAHALLAWQHPPHGNTYYLLIFREGRFMHRRSDRGFFGSIPKIVVPGNGDRVGRLHRIQPKILVKGILNESAAICQKPAPKTTARVVMDLRIAGASNQAGSA